LIIRSRYIPVLLIKDRQLYKTVKFNKEIKYIGDPVNAIRIFNEKEVDEICVLDIGASKENREPDFEFIKELASECFMPLGYGGGINNITTIEKLFKIGIEKTILNNVLIENPQLVTEAANVFGSQSIIASVDVKKNLWGQYSIYSHVTNQSTKQDLQKFIRNLQELGIGELIINSVDQDGMMKGYDYNLISQVSSFLTVPIVALGGAGSVLDLEEAINQGAHAAAAGSLFIYKGPHKAVLINYPTIKN
jgi:cyclase